MFLIDNRPCSDVIRSVMTDNPEMTSRQVTDVIQETYNEDWFMTVTPSLRGSDNRLFHRVRSVFSKSVV